MRSTFGVFLLFMLQLPCLTAVGQLPKSVEITNENATVVLSNFKWMTTRKLAPVEGGFGQPVDPKPLDPTKLYTPGTDAYLYFDYEKRIESTDKPEGVAEVYVTMSGQIGNRPFKLVEAQGVGYIGLVFNVYGGPTPRIDGDFDLPIAVYGKRTNGAQLPSVVSNEKLKLRISIDGVATITETQFEALKALYRKVEALEIRVLELENQK